jgi:UDP-N-acetylglucosamine 2-epimerase (non-hydrolysing)
LRDTTERPETVEIGTNEIVGSDSGLILSLLDRIESGGWKKGSVPPLWDGQSGRRIVAVFEQLALGAEG